ncbi:hypothetical protein [Bradyrhizobium sp. 2S1]|uniref:hypothetical protein n=1 Tax=Bradyrhizobium sp. 2S1 TaxID=1404429 RepID=UPI00140E5905
MIDHDFGLETADRNHGHRISVSIADAGQAENHRALLDPKQMMPPARLAAGALPDGKQVDIAANDVQNEIEVIDRQRSVALEPDWARRRAFAPERSFEGGRLVDAVHSLDTSWTYSPPSASSS